MKTYRNHRCTRRHRTPSTMAKCMFPRAAWVTGEGQYALLAWCDVLTVSLHEKEADAVGQKEWIDYTACGHACYKKHEVVFIRMPD